MLRFASCLPGFVALGLIFLQPVAAQTRMPDTYLARLQQAEAATAALPAAAFGPAGDAALDKLVLQHRGPLGLLGTARSMVGDTEGALATFDVLRRRQLRHTAAVLAQMSHLENAAAEDAIAAIVREARTKRVVLINEAHHVPLHRAFAQRLAAELRKVGYTYLAAETFTEAGVAATSGRRYIGRRIGFYTEEPVFAGFVNAALADGWKLVPYEFEGGHGAPPAEQFRMREEGQARNLVERIFAKDKDAKVLIHVGYGHLYKSSPGGKEDRMMMGGYLRRMTGLPMLHVDQTNFFAHPDPADENPLYAPLLAKYPSNAPFILKNKDGSYPVLLGLGELVDMQVIHPRYPVRDGRPGWLASLAGRSAQPVPANLLPASGRRVLKATPAAAPADAVPVDIIMVEAGKAVPKFMLANEAHRFSVEE